MKRLYAMMLASLLGALVLGCLISAGAVQAIQRDLLAPPLGTLQFGVLSITAERPCPFVPWPALGADMQCTARSPWTLTAHISAGGRWHRWQIVSLTTYDRDTP
jgi:hypothetical protein